MFMIPYKTFTLLTLVLYYTTASLLHDELTPAELLNITLSIKRREVQVPICFYCMFCNKVTITTPTVECPSGRCYLALGNEDGDFELGGVRGCVEVNTDECPDIETKYLKEFRTRTRTAAFTNCKTCNSTSGSPCNDAPFEVTGTSPVICYKCSECDHVENNTPYVICPEDKCCFRAAFQNYKNAKYYSVRGCWRLEKHKSCDNVCEDLRKKHLRNYPQGRMHVCIRCAKGDSNNCNYFPFDLPTKALTEKRAIMCYNCIDCHQVTSVTPNVLCRHSRCCYSAVFKTSNSSGLTVERGCAIPDPGRTCDQTCHDIERKYGISIVQKCIMCEENDFNECNAYPYDISISTEIAEGQLVSCYSCRNCNIVKGRTSLLLCDPVCCYRALVQMSADEDWSAIRGCIQVKTGQKCEEACSIVEKRHNEEHRHGSIRVCIQCKKGAFNRCNEPSFSAEDLENTGAVKLKCYDCVKCHKVVENTDVVECGDGRCCYSAYIKHKPGGDYSVTRGCGKIYKSRPCAETCRDQRNRHLWKHPSGEFVRCLPCRDGDKCNNYTYYDKSIKAETETKRKSIACYDCTDCYVVSKETHLVTCRLPECCYIVELKDYYTDNVYIKRGCLHKGDCTELCLDVKNDYLWTHPEGVFINCTNCLPNGTNECNSATFEVPAVQTTLSPDVDYIMCYECEDCNIITPRIRMVTCLLPGSCYIILVRAGTNTEKFAVRGCTKGGGGKESAATCKTIEDNHKEIHPDYTYHYCLTCGDRQNAIGCNKNYYNARLTTTDSIPCYNCSDCNQVPDSMPTINCTQPKCCYMALVRTKLSDTIFAIRGCKRSKHCGDTCTLVENDHKGSYPEGTVNFCMYCEKSVKTTVCNGNTYIP